MANLKNGIWTVTGVCAVTGYAVISICINVSCPTWSCLGPPQCLFLGWSNTSSSDEELSVVHQYYKYLGQVY